MRKAGVVLCLFTVMLLGACKRNTAHLSPEKMQPILADLYLADAYSGFVRDTSEKSFGKNYDSLAIWTKSILAKHHTSEKEFNQSLDWYRDRPEELDTMFAKVIPILERSRK